MTVPFPLAFEDAKAHAREVYPQESCGLIVLGDYIRCENIAGPIEDHREGDPDCGCKLCSFEIDPKFYVHHEREGIDFVVHSHPNGPFFPSEADMIGQAGTDVPWAIIALDGDRVAEMPVMWGDDLPIPPIVGREFMHGVTDCYSLIRDSFRLGREALAAQGCNDWPYDPIVLPDYPRKDGWWTPEIGSADLYAKNFADAGFREIHSHEAQPGDVFLIKIRSKQLNHGGVLIGDGLILHHINGRPSRREPAGLYGHAAEKWLRYEGAPSA